MQRRRRVSRVARAARSMGAGGAYNFERLAKAAGLPNTITDKPDKAWVFIPVSPDGSHSDLEARLDKARDLIAEAENAGRISANTETIIRTWWARQRH